MPYSDYAAHLSITNAARLSGNAGPFPLDHLPLVFHHHDFLDHNSLSLSLPARQFYLPLSPDFANPLEVASSICSNHAIMLGVK